MEIYNNEVEIPQYPFEIDPNTGNPFFRIIRDDCIVNYKRSDFLVPHRKDYYFFALVRKGDSRHWIDMKPYTIRPNTIYFTTPVQVNLKEEAKPMDGIVLSFNKDFLELDGGFLRGLPIIQNLHNGHELALADKDRQYLEDLLERILVEYQANADWQNNMVGAYMRVFLIYLSRLYTEQFNNDGQTAEKAMLNRFLEKVDESFRTAHEVTAYADMLNISAGHLSELVKEQSGRSAIKHIHERISLEAKLLLFHTENSVKEIAFDLGFEDASYFNRFFKRVNDQTPVRFRHTVREMYH